MAATHFTDDTFEEQVLKSDKPVLVDFWAEWCMPCQMVGPVVEELAEELKDKIKVGKVNVDENTKVPASYNVMSIPSLIVFKEGKPFKVMVGVQSKDALKSALDEALS